jgi:hypothetical protein
LADLTDLSVDLRIDLDFGDRRAVLDLRGVRRAGPVPP